jgi:CDP-diacylglycerol--serine O-phosphatidyltransferase
MKKRSSFLFVLPNLFTVSSIFCGLYAIIQATDGTAADRYYRAAVAILFAVIFDSADGRVARMTRTQSAFGLQMDSLADAISFGVAPAILVYKWALASFGLVGMFVSFVYASCGVIRLARFNVMASKEKKVPRYFSGLPIPLAAVSLTSLVLLHYRTGGVQFGNQPVMLAVMLVLAGLMVSNIRYRTFKDLRADRWALSTIIVLAAFALFAAWKTSFSLVFMVVCAGLIAFGPAEELVRFVRQRLPGVEEEPVEEEEEEETV